MTPKSLVKILLRVFLPHRLYLRLFSIRSRRYNDRYLEGLGCQIVNEKLLKRFGPRVMAGPFAGLLLPAITHTTRIGPFLLGTYEVEIVPWLLSLRNRKFAQLLNVGSSFGYYAVGMAGWFPCTPVIAFDTDPWAQQATLELANANEISNLVIKEYCDLRWLAANLQENAFIICDCEGFEFELLNPKRAPHLITSTIIVECHDIPPWTKHSKLIKLFETTHHVSEATFNGKSPSPTVDIDFLTSHERCLAVDSGRTPGQKWLFFDPIR